MKKLIALLACATIFGSILMAEAISDDPFEREKFEAEKTSTYVIVPEEQHVTDKNASVKIEYSPIYDEAMNTVIACLQDFQKENKYINYKYLKPESQKFFKDDRGQRKAQWSAYLKFTR